ncbi:peroxiredoxin family protein [Litoribacillus peritrichatus]|uniref:Thioredoxin domain-containing protein n=1 Tax=Litoribacillus peritrichatus TaxID=718191 RepID=A0ABP7MB34_9GAMM
MQKLKSIFISSYCTYLTLVTLWAGYQYLQSDSVAMAVIAIQHLVGASFFASLFAVPPARTSALLPNWTIPALMLAFAGGYQGYMEGSALVVILAAVGWLGWSLYLFWYSSFGGKRNDQLVLGQTLPEFTLYQSDGKSVSASDFQGKPVLMIFYRGNWCPLCVAQVKEISGMYQQLADMGVEVCLVSPQPEENTQQLADRFNVPFNFLVDKDLATAEAFGIKAEGGTPAGFEALGYDSDTVRPTVLITNSKGELIYSDLTDNYRVRPEPEEFIKVFQQAGVA